MTSLSPSLLFLRLQGLLCLHKPPNQNTAQLLASLRHSLVHQMNSLPQPSPAVVATVTSLPDGRFKVVEERRPVHQLSLVDGPRTSPNEISLWPVDPLCPFSSGVQLVGVNRLGRAVSLAMHEAQLMRVYRLHARLGRSTADGTPDSPTKLRSTWGHVTQPKVDRLCAAIQSQYQRRMFEMAGVNAHSQEAFELAARGLVRPKRRLESKRSFQETTPMIYGLRCVEFSPPNFVLELHCVNESSRFLRLLVHDLAMELSSTAHCRAIRRIRYGRLVSGPKSLLVPADCSLESVVDNMDLCHALHPLSSLHYHADKFEAVSDTPLLSE